MQEKQKISRPLLDSPFNPISLILTFTPFTTDNTNTTPPSVTPSQPTIHNFYWANVHAKGEPNRQSPAKGKRLHKQYLS